MKKLLDISEQLTIAQYWEHITDSCLKMSILSTNTIDIKFKPRHKHTFTVKCDKSLYVEVLYNANRKCFVVKQRPYKGPNLKPYQLHELQHQVNFQKGLCKILNHWLKQLPINFRAAVSRAGLKSMRKRKTHGLLAVKKSSKKPAIKIKRIYGGKAYSLQIGKKTSRKMILPTDWTMIAPSITVKSK